VIEDASTAELSSPAQLAEVFFTSRRKRSYTPAREAAEVCLTSAPKRGCREAVPQFFLGVMSRFLNAVYVRPAGERLRREVRDATVQTPFGGTW